VKPTIDKATLHDLLLDAVNEALPQMLVLKDEARAGGGYGAGILFVMFQQKINKYFEAQADVKAES